MTVVAEVGWTLSAARTLTLSEQATAVVRSRSQAALPLIWPGMASADALDFAIDPTAWLTEIADELVSVTASVPALVLPTDLQLLWVTILQGMAVIFAAGGQPNTTVPVELVLTTAAGRRVAQLSHIVINGDSPAMPAPAWPQLTVGTGTMGIPPNAIVLPNGKILTNAAGLPYLLA